MKVSPFAGKPPEPGMLVNVPKLITAYYTDVPDPSIPAQRVAFGTSGHRGSSLQKAFNEWHILAITQAICLYRKLQHTDGPLFLGMDTHALSMPAFASSLEVLAANGVEVVIAEGDEYTPTPVISHAILTHNRGRRTGLADGVVITPSHNPPDDGGFKYNPPNGGPAETDVTDWIQATANQFLESTLQGIKRIPFEQALRASTTHRHDFLSSYISDLANVIDMDSIRGAKVNMGVDPLGGAGVHYWARIADQYKLDLTVVNELVDPTFRFMTVDWDGQIRMDPSSSYAMTNLIGLKDRFDIAFACDTDHDRHGIVTRDAGLLQPNHYLAVAIYYLFQHRPKWNNAAAIGKTMVSSQMIDRVTAKLGRKLYEVPVGFKWFVDGLLDGTLGFGGEESAGASFLRLDGTVWTTDKDGIVPALLAAEITARMNRDPGEIYDELTSEFGNSVYTRTEAPATVQEKEILRNLSPQQVRLKELAGEQIQTILTHAPGNGAPLGGLKVVAESGWFAARPSGTEDIYKIYVESFRGTDHLRRILDEAQTIVSDAVAKAGFLKSTTEERYD
ncbi:MAG TPA: phosphoglucomutase (alpha-D-glucose-1,6-bisphosphate-dependent) [Pyrinomonadaceae bacterium]|nr:phosphoglucomutase (alpha-D-glucose-1,6-bisphosphate-dependent) [Pyrinomonadaceae bacterium]